MTNHKNSIVVREVALEVLIEVLEKQAYSHKVMGAVLTKYQYIDKKDRSFLTRLCEGTIEHLIEIDYIIDQFSKVKVKKQKPVIRNILRMAVYQILYMDSVPDRATCNEAVKLATKKGFHTLKGFVNGVLRTIARQKDTIQYPNRESAPLQYLSIRYSMPEWILNEWSEQYSLQQIETILQGFYEINATTIRVNTQKIAVDELKKKLEEEQINVEKGNYLPYALKIKHFDYLEAIQSFQEGLFQVQDESSMLVGEISGVKTGDYVIDVCAAPGGKSLHVAEKMAGTGTVLSRDLTAEKVQLIETNKERLGIINLETQVYDALVLDESKVGVADVVIADLPCSGLGVIGKKTDIKYKMSKKQQMELVALQREILDVVYQYVKPGGVLLFSTCTINIEENEKNIEWIEENLPLKMESITEYLPEELQGETTDRGYLQLLPGIHGTDGFFLARFRKE